MCGSCSLFRARFPYHFGIYAKGCIAISHAILDFIVDLTYFAQFVHQLCTIHLFYNYVFILLYALIGYVMHKMHGILYSAKTCSLYHILATIHYTSSLQKLCTSWTVQENMARV